MKQWNILEEEEDRYLVYRAKDTFIDQILGIYERAVGITAAPFYTQEQITAWQRSILFREKWLKRIKDDLFLVAEQGHKIVGFICLQNQNYIDLLFTDPSYNRKGVASKLLSEALKGVKGEVTTHASEVSRSFFAKHGFEFVKENKLHYEGADFVNYLMRKEL